MAMKALVARGEEVILCMCMPRIIYIHKFISVKTFI